MTRCAKCRRILGRGAGLAVLAWAGCVPDFAAGQTIYGYEDGLGMLHTSPRKLDGRYKELYTLRPGEKKPGHQALIAALREKRAIEDAIPVTSVADLLAGLDARGEAILRAAERFWARPTASAGIPRPGWTARG
jgi:hypothetical protein